MSLSSPYQPVQIPEQSLYEFIFGSLTQEELGLPAISDSATGQTITFGELRAAVNALAGAIAAKGVRPHHVVALHCPNSIAFAICFHGIMRAGGTVTTLNALATQKDIENQLKDSDAEMVFSLSMLGTAAVDAARAVGIEEDKIVVIDDPQSGLKSLLAQQLPAPELRIDPITHLAALPYSSGTVGKPKGVRLSHRNLVANLCQMQPMFYKLGLSRETVVMHVLPYFHIYGMNCLLNLGLYCRMRSVTMPRFDLQSFLELHEKFKINFTFIAPPIAVALAKHPMVDNYDLSSLIGMLSGASSLDGELAEAVSKRLDCMVIQGFGMTETSPVTHLLVDRSRPLSSIGQALPNTEFKVVDVASDRLAEILPPSPDEIQEDIHGNRKSPDELRSEDGELWIRGPQVMVGYLKNQEADAKTITPEGWLRTGDIVNMDIHANVYVVDRMKELIKYKGYQVAPAELEALLLTHEDIADCAVVGYVRESDGEEVPRAFVVPQDGREVDEEALMAWVTERVAPYKKIRIVEVIPEIPKSVTGKILRKELRKRPLAV